MKRGSDQRAIGYVKGATGNIEPDGRPFYRLQLDSSAIETLLSYLDQIAQTNERLWHTMTATSEHPSRLRLYRIPTPDFEQRASQIYVGTLFRISGRESINVSFSCEGALWIAKRFREARQRMRRFVLFRVPIREERLLEFVPDVELEAVTSQEHDRLGEVGGILAADVWGHEDFSDWEQES